jgi:hypothetical protein
MFLLYNFVPYSAFWNLLEREISADIWKQIIPSADRVHAEYGNVVQKEKAEERKETGENAATV